MPYVRPRGLFRRGAAGTLANPANEAWLRSAIQTHLQAVGMRSVASGADCLVGYGIGVRDVLEGPKRSGDGALIDAAVAAIFTEYPGRVGS